MESQTESTGAETRSLWEENNKAFLNVIFKDHRYFREAEFISSFNEKQYMFLMKAQRLGEYSWDIDIYNKFIEALHALGSGGSGRVMVLDLGIIQTRRLRFNGLGKDKIIEYLPSDYSYIQGSKIGKINVKRLGVLQISQAAQYLDSRFDSIIFSSLFGSSEDKNIITNLVKPLKYREGCRKVVFHSSTSYEDDSTENDLVQNDFNRFSEIIEIFPNLETLQINTQVLKIEYLKFLLEADRSCHIQTIQFNYKASSRFLDSRLSLKPREEIFQGTHRDLSTEEHKSDFLFTESETGTNSIHVEYILSRMKFKIPDFISEIDNLDRTCSIEITYNRPPGTVFEEFQQVIDAIFCKRLTTLRINMCFLPEDCEDYLLEKIKESKTLLELYINFRKEVYGFQILDSLQSVQSLRYLELQCRVSHTSELHSKIDEFISTKSNQVIVKIPDPKKPRSTMWLYKDSAFSCPIIMPPYPVPQSQN